MLVLFCVAKAMKTFSIFHTSVVVSSGWRHWLHCVSKYWNSFKIWCSWTPEAEDTYQIQVMNNKRTQRMWQISLGYCCTFCSLILELNKMNQFSVT